MEVRPLGLEGVVEIRTRRFGDERGFFTETWNRETFAASGIDLDWVQDNHSLSRDRGVLRGLHLQTPPHAQDKLVRVLRGSVFDVAVDVREGSPTHGQWVSLTLSAEEGNQILVPAGYAHGFLTLEPDTEVAYKVTGRYAPDCDRSIAHDDPLIGIEWPIAREERILSAKDRDARPLAEVDTGFRYDDHRHASGDAS